MSPLHDMDVATVKATFALGCFWGPDAYYGATPGVVRTRVGFSGGTKDNPTYKSIGDHTEVIEIDFDPTKIEFKELLDIFWNNHDPTARTTKQYTSIIFYHNEEQKALAEETLKEKQSKSQTPLVTTVEAAARFYNAEDYHQKYRLQQHSFLIDAIKLKPTTENLIRSHVAARLNGYVVGCGGVKQFDEEAPQLGLSEEAIDFARKLVVKFEGHGPFC